MPSLVHTVSVDVKQHLKKMVSISDLNSCVKVEVAVLVTVLNNAYGFSGRKATFEEDGQYFRPQDLCESRSGVPGFPVPNSQYNLCERKATLTLNSRHPSSGGVSKLR